MVGTIEVGPVDGRPMFASEQFDHFDNVTLTTYMFAVAMVGPTRAILEGGRSKGADSGFARAAAVSLLELSGKSSDNARVAPRRGRPSAKGRSRVL